MTIKPAIGPLHPPKHSPNRPRRPPCRRPPGRTKRPFTAAIRATTARPGGTGAAAHPPDAPGPPAPALGGFTSASGPSAPPSRRAAAARPRSGRRATYAALKSRLEAPPASRQLARRAPRAAAAPGRRWKGYAGR